MGARVAAANRRPNDLANYKDFPSYVKGYFGASLVAAWLLQDPTGSSQATAINQAPAALGRELCINGGFDVDASWAKGAGWTISGGVAHAVSAGAGGTFTQSPGFAVPSGKFYKVTYTVLNYVQGTIQPNSNASPGGTPRSANGTYTEIVPTMFGFYTGGSFTGDIDNVSVKQVNIPASDSYGYKQLLADGDMSKVGVADWTPIASATLTKQFGTGYNGGSCLRVARNGSTTPCAAQTILTVGVAYRVYGWYRSDGTAVPIVRHGTTTLITGVAGTNWQRFDVVFVATATDLRLGSTTNTGTQFVEFSGVTCAEDTFVRSDQLCIDADMEKAGVTDWIVRNGATLTKQGSAHTGTQCLRVARNVTNNPYATQGNLVVGKTYKISGWYKSDGSAIPLIYIGTLSPILTGTAAVVWTYFEAVGVAGTFEMALQAQTSTGNQFVDFDDVAIIEVAPMVGKYTNGAAPGSAGLPGELAASFDGTNDFTNVYSADLNSIFPTGEGTLVAYGQMLNAGVWTDAANRYLVQLGDGGGIAFIFIRKSNTTNTMAVNYTPNAGSKNVTTLILGGNTGFFQVAITWSKSADQVKMYVNGLQVGTTQTGLGTWVGNITSAGNAIGAANSSGGSPHKGIESNVILLNRPATAAEIYEMARREGLAA